MWGNDKERGEDAKPARSNKPSNTVDTLIGRQSEVVGDVQFAGGLHVDGGIRGKVTADSDDNAVLSVSESGYIEGDVRVAHVVLNGSVEGDVHVAQRITLSARARVNGNVYYQLIEMASGAMVNGQLVHEGEESDNSADDGNREDDALPVGDDESAPGFGATAGKTGI